MADGRLRVRRPSAPSTSQNRSMTSSAPSTASSARPARLQAMDGHHIPTDATTSVTLRSIARSAGRPEVFSIVRPLANRAVVAALDLVVRVVPLVGTTVRRAFAGNAQVDEDLWKVSSQARAPTKPTVTGVCHYHRLRPRPLPIERLTELGGVLICRILCVGGASASYPRMSGRHDVIRNGGAATGSRRYGRDRNGLPPPKRATARDALSLSSFQPSMRRNATISSPRVTPM
jgi:hypothetical protein